MGAGGVENSVRTEEERSAEAGDDFLGCWVEGDATAKGTGTKVSFAVSDVRAASCVSEGTVTAVVVSGVRS